MGCAISIEKVDGAAKKQPNGGGGGFGQTGPPKAPLKVANGGLQEEKQKSSWGAAAGKVAGKGSGRGGGDLGKESPAEDSGGSSGAGAKVNASNSSSQDAGGGGGSGPESGCKNQNQNHKAHALSTSLGNGQITEEQLQAITGFESLRKFSYREMQKATKKFSTKLGEGGFGSVFKGRVSMLDPESGKPAEDGQHVSVAIKVLDPDSLQGAKEWMTEVEHLAALKHKHVVRLLGYCQEQSNWMLVYEFVPYGSFDYHIFASERPPVSFADRLKVALHAAKGLQFLHDNNVIYRDFKTSNILVDQNFNAKLADFGLARAGPDEQGTHVSTGVKGTVSYMAPEYISTGHLTQKCDVYSFGVVLLEILCGRQASATKDDTGATVPRLVGFANKIGHDKSRMFEMLDHRLRDPEAEPGGPVKPGPGVPPKAFKIVLQAGLFCIERQGSARPEMKTLVESLSVAHAICVRAAEMKAKEAEGAGKD